MARKIIGKAVWLAKGAAIFWGAVLTLAVVLGGGATALAAVPGDPFSLGQTNAINALSVLTGNTDSAMLSIRNSSSGASATALDLRVTPAKAPMKVSVGAGKVANLDADRLDGKSAEQLVRVAYFNGESPLADGANGTLATTTITAPASGFLVINAGSDFFNLVRDANPLCWVEVDNSFALGSQREVRLNHASRVNQEEDCSTNTVFPVAAGTHTVDLQVDFSNRTGYLNTALSAIYVPFDGTGAPPSSSAISAAREQEQAPEATRAREESR